MGADPARLDHRAGRLSLYAEMAPHPVLAEECRLYLRAYHGSDLRAALSILYALASRKWWRLRNRVEASLHHLGLHFPDTLDGRCWVCDRDRLRAESGWNNYAGRGSDA